MDCTSCANTDYDLTGLGGSGFELGLVLPLAAGFVTIEELFGKKKKKKKKEDDDVKSTPTCTGTLHYGTSTTALNWIRENCGGYGYYYPINTLVFPEEWCVGCGDLPPSDLENPAVIGTSQ